MIPAREAHRLPTCRRPLDMPAGISEFGLIYVQYVTKFYVLPKAPPRWQSRAWLPRYRLQCCVYASRKYGNM